MPASDQSLTADLEICAQSLSVSKMPSIESSFIERRKHDDICGVGVPALNIVGVACVNHLSLIRWYLNAQQGPHASRSEEREQVRV